MSVLSAPPPKTSVNRVLLFFVVGFATSTPLLIFALFFLSWTSMLLVPLGVTAVLIFTFFRENRISDVKPKSLEIFLSALGVFFPSVLVAIVLWVLWWVTYGLGVLFGMEQGMYGGAYTFASTLFGLLSAGFAIFLVTVNWRHLVDQLYPEMGSHSAFAQMSESGKSWLIKRGIIFAVLFFITVVLSFAITALFFSEGEDVTIGDEFLMSLFVAIVYLFFVGISSWLWLRQAEIPRGVEVTNKAVARLLQPLGYEVETLAAIKSRTKQEAAISDSMTASVDLVARREGSTLVLDVMTPKETHEIPDWVVASEFRMATWYLKRVLNLPVPVESVLILVDVVADDTLFAFAEDQAIRVIQLSGEEVIDLLSQDMSEMALQQTAVTLFSPVSKNGMNLSSSKQPMLENGGRNE